MNNFWRGFCVAIAYQQMTQDLIGKERYLKAIDVMWIDSKWWVWALAIVFVIALPYLEKVSDFYLGGKK